MQLGRKTAGPSPRSHQRRRYLGLIAYKTYAELRAESTRTYLGFAWWVVEPLLSMAVYYLVFETILDRGTEDYALFLIVGLVPWRWFASGIHHGSQSILGARSLMLQVYLPKIVLPTVSLFCDSVKFLAVLVAMVPLLAAVGQPPNSAYLALPLVVFVQGLFNAAVVFLFAALTPLLPDMRMVLGSVVRLWFFVSGVFHPVSEVSGQAQGYLRLNPMTNLIEAYREIILLGSWPDLSRLAGTALTSATLLLIGERLIRRLDFHYPKIIR